MDQLLKMLRRDIFAELRAQGFTRKWRRRPTQYDPGCEQWEAVRGDRFLHVQIWGDNANRVSHGVFTKLGKQSMTRPTEFSDVTSMRDAIEFEWVRPSRSEVA